MGSLIQRALVGPQSSRSPELLMFDLGGVLVDNVVFERLKAIPGLGLAEAAMKSKWLASETVRAFELGALSPAAFARDFVAEWNMPVAPETFLADFATWPKGFYPGALALLSQLRARFKVACLSNSNTLHWERIGDLHEHFDVALSSHLLGAIKPDSACFDRALQQCGVAKSRVAFFDDSLDNVGAAEELGIQSFHVCGLDQARSVLARNGWLN